MKTETYEKYKKAWDRRLKEEEKELDRKREQLIRKVRLCAYRLKKLGGKRVILFGSLATGNFRRDSDVDIAVEGLSVDAYFKALGILEETLDDVTFDLVDLKEALPSVVKRIEREGIQI
ncbi:MAG: nucleotidyltransferase domain-containing protein [Nitrospirota bacterium]